MNHLIREIILCQGVDSHLRVMEVIFDEKDAFKKAHAFPANKLEIVSVFTCALSSAFGLLRIFSIIR